MSDRIGREPTMCIAFGLEAIAMTLWLLTRDNTLLFVLFSGLVFFGWGEIFSLFPSTLADTFGEKHATTNYKKGDKFAEVGSLICDETQPR